TLAAQERTFGPAIDAATGRETDAASRESVERQEATRLSASVSGAASRTQQIELRKQVLGARNRQLAAFEARLVARGEKIDALERQNRAKAERLDAWARRLDTRAERLELLERRASEAAPKPAAAPKPLEAKPAAAKDKAVFVMVVKSPTAIVKERSGAAPSGAPLSAGVAVEKAVAAATVVTFPSPASTLSELDRETIDNIAQLAAKESCEILIWARAKDPSMMAEAQRRAGDLKARVVASGPLPEQRVVTRITTRPGAQGVDVVVSALRETAKPAPAAGAGGSAQLEAGEGGKRQIREAVQAAQPLIEGCIGEHIQARRLQRAEGTLKLTVTAQGKVQSVRAVGSDLGSEALDACLAASSGKWQFPSAEAEYVVDVPITVVQGGGTR
ncbi:MAG TPA: AgmX/PglI C-terminal domain-containing protein, partial [Anaeromyxobacter sp.]